MSFLDNLENNLKALESREERDPLEGKRREADAARARAVAPWAEKLKSGAWTQQLMGEATAAGFRRRKHVRISWIGSTLRLEAKERRLDLRPEPEGIAAVFSENGAEVRTEAVDLEQPPGGLVEILLA